MAIKAGSIIKVGSIIMAKKGFSEKEEHDPLSLFIKKSNSWITEYFKPFLFLLLAGILIFGLVLFYSYWQKLENQKGAKLLYQSRKELVQWEKKAGGNVLSFDSSQNFFEQAKKAKYNSEMNEKVNKHIILINKWIAKPAGLFATMEMVYFLLEYEKPKMAMALLNKAVLHKKKNTTGFLSAFQAGIYLMDQGEYEKAEQSFQFITENEKAKWLWPMSLVKIALCYEKQNKWDKAKEVYRRLKNDFSDSPSAERAEKYLNLLALKARMDKPMDKPIQGNENKGEKQNKLTNEPSDKSADKQPKDEPADESTDKQPVKEKTNE